MTHLPGVNILYSGFILWFVCLCYNLFKSHQMSKLFTFPFCFLSGRFFLSLLPSTPISTHSPPLSFLLLTFLIPPPPPVSDLSLWFSPSPSLLSLALPSTPLHHLSLSRAAVVYWEWEHLCSQLWSLCSPPPHPPTSPPPLPLSTCILICSPADTHQYWNAPRNRSTNSSSAKTPFNAWQPSAEVHTQSWILETSMLSFCQYQFVLTHLSRALTKYFVTSTNLNNWFVRLEKSSHASFCKDENKLHLPVGVLFPSGCSIIVTSKNVSHLHVNVHTITCNKNHLTGYHGNKRDSICAFQLRLIE